MEKIKKSTKKIKIPEVLENNENGKIVYLQLHHELIEQKAINESEYFCFLTYCIEFGNYINLEKDIQAEGFTLNAANGTIMQNPKCLMKQASFNSLMKAALHLGITPKSRIKKQINAKMSLLDTLKAKAKKS